MDHGVIAEQGAHEELMARHGVYYHLQMLQNGTA
jgi:ABC-type multidrug transport system fused ATPase/permease subunit